MHDKYTLTRKNKQCSWINGHWSNESEWDFILSEVKASGILSHTTIGWADIDVQTYFAAVFACLQQTHLVLFVFVCRGDTTAVL